MLLTVHVALAQRGRPRHLTAFLRRLLLHLLTLLLRCLLLTLLLGCFLLPLLLHSFLPHAPCIVLRAHLPQEASSTPVGLRLLLRLQHLFFSCCSSLSCSLRSFSLRLFLFVAVPGARLAHGTPLTPLFVCRFSLRWCRILLPRTLKRCDLRLDLRGLFVVLRFDSSPLPLLEFKNLQLVLQPLCFCVVLRLHSSCLGCQEFFLRPPCLPRPPWWLGGVRCRSLDLLSIVHLLRGDLLRGGVVLCLILLFFTPGFMGGMVPRSTPPWNSIRHLLLPSLLPLPFREPVFGSGLDTYLFPCNLHVLEFDDFR
eukprot:Sspe_Gene.35945::Locus_17408_Transcript_1_1_Confidence_1.000_Length_1462::g.35945::m.35945